MKKIIIIHFLFLLVGITANADSDDPIAFEDINVKTICVNKWDINKDGELSEEEAASVKTIGTVFQKNTNIQRFNELKYFTSLTSIPSSAFSYCNNLTEITLPANGKITSIGKEAFFECFRLGDIIIPEGVTYIGVRAFYECDFQTITIPATITSIDECAFAWCRNLLSATILGTITTMPGTFSNCQKLEHANIPEGVKTMKGTFNSCYNLKSINIPKSVTDIWGNTSYHAFDGCHSLEEIVVDEGNNIYDSRDNCNALIQTNGNLLLFGCRNTVIPSSVQSIGAKSIYGVKGLKEITIPAGCISIGSDAFKSCTDLLKITSKVTTPYNISAFDNTTLSKGTLIVPKGCREAYATTDGWKDFLIYEEDETVHLKTFMDEQGIIYTLNGGGASYSVTDCNAEKLTANIVFPSDIEGVPMTGISSGSIKASVASIINTITLPATLTRIDDNFSYCTNLKRVFSRIVEPFVTSFSPWNRAVLIVPKGTRSDYKSVSGWKGAIVFEEEESIFDKTETDLQGIVYTLNQDTNYKVYYNTTGHLDDLLSDITIPNNIKGCPVYYVTINSFSDCTRLMKVTISNGLKNINFSAFSGCIKLKEFISLITTPSSVSVSIPEEIYKRANLIVPVGKRVDYLNSNWKKFRIFEQGETVINYDLSPIDEQGLIFQLGQNDVSFYYRLSGHSDDLSENVIIPAYLNGLPVTIIDNNTFNECTTLTSVSIPSTISSIGYRAFSGCNSLIFVTVGMLTPVSIDAMTFTNRSNATLYVPAGSKVFYEAAPYWQDFKEIIEKEANPLTGDVNGDDSVDIGDIVMVICVMTGTDTDAAIMARADVNGDGAADIGDIVSIISIMTGQPAQARAYDAARVWQQENSDRVSMTMENNAMHLSLDNSREYSAFQFQLTLPEGTSPVDLVINNQRGQGHVATIEPMGNGQYLVMGYSLGNKAFNGYNGELLTLYLKGQQTDQVAIYNVIFSDAKGQTYRLMGGETTGVGQIDNGKLKMDNSVYDLQGRKFTIGKNGIYLIGNKKVVIK